MNCETLEDWIVELADRTLDPTAAADARAHLATCASCRREVARHRAAGRLLDELPSETTSEARLRQMAAAVLASVNAEPAGETAEPAAPRVISRWTQGRRSKQWARVAAAAALVVATALGTEWIVHSRAPTPATVDPSESCLSDPEFVSDFEVLRDLPELADSSDGQMLDLDHDDVVMLQLFEDV